MPTLFARARPSGRVNVLGVVSRISLMRPLHHLSPRTPYPPPPPPPPDGV